MTGALLDGSLWSGQLYDHLEKMMFVSAPVQKLCIPIQVAVAWPQAAPNGTGGQVMPGGLRVLRVRCDAQCGDAALRDRVFEGNSWQLCRWEEHGGWKPAWIYAWLTRCVCVSGRGRRVCGKAWGRGGDRGQGVSVGMEGCVYV